MDFILHYVNQGFTYIVPFIILLGILIFVHELGHFLVAVFYGVRVETFSLGFGKKFLRYKRGDTEYCLSIIPFGGYVKMYGDDPTANIPDDQKKYSFTHKPVGQRIAVVLAGPLMNLFFAFFLFAVIAMVGEEVPRPIVGDLSPKSAAYSFGLRAEDEVTAVNNQSVETWPELKEAIEANGTGPLQLSVRRAGSSEPITIQAKTHLVPNPNILSTEAEVGDIEGLNFLFKSSVIAVSHALSDAGAAGLKTGDRVISLNGTSIERWVDMARAASSATDKLDFVVERAEENAPVKKVEVSVSLSKIDQTSLGNDSRGDKILNLLGVEVPDLYVSSVVPDSAAAAAGIQRGDKIVSVNGEISEWSDLVKRVQAFEPGQAPLKVKALRQNQEIQVEVTPKQIVQTNPAGKEMHVYAIGVVAGVVHANPLTMIQKTSNPLKALKRGFTDSALWTKNTALSFLRLIQNKVSAKSIGGPIMIGQLASRTFEIGLSPFLKIMAIISINLFILNLLPVPVLDGGHLVFFTIEALKGAPLSMRKMEIAQQVGLVLLMSLMVFALFNDVSRLFN